MGFQNTNLVAAVPRGLRLTNATGTPLEMRFPRPVRNDHLPLLLDRSVKESCFRTKSNDKGVQMCRSASQAFPVHDILNPFLDETPSFDPYWESAVAGSTVILTSKGTKKATELKVGDNLITRDQGLQPVKKITIFYAPRTNCVRKQPRAGSRAPGLSMSPNHRVLVRSPMAELYFGFSEVLVTAGDLVDHVNTQKHCVSGTPFVHIGLDQPNLVKTNEYWTEWQAGRDTERPNNNACGERMNVFSDCDQPLGDKASVSSRIVLSRSETRVLFSIIDQSDRRNFLQ